jgi:hypothetical protein
VLAPTRELAVQIHQEATKFSASSTIKCTLIYGGVPKGPQVRNLQKGFLSLTLKRTLLAYKLGIDCIKKWCLLGVSSGCQNWICLDEV